MQAGMMPGLQGPPNLSRHYHVMNQQRQAMGMGMQGGNQPETFQMTQPGLASNAMGTNTNQQQQQQQTNAMAVPNQQLAGQNLSSTVQPTNSQQPGQQQQTTQPNQQQQQIPPPQQQVPPQQQQQQQQGQPQQPTQNNASSQGIKNASFSPDMLQV